MNFEGLSLEEFESYLVKDLVTGHWHWTGPITSGGIPYVWIRGSSYRARNVAWAFRYEPLSDKTTLEPLCDCKNCVSPDHAREVRAERVVMPSDFSARNKLTASDIMDIRARFDSGARQTDLAREYGVSQPQISMIIRNRAWKHIH